MGQRLLTSAKISSEQLRRTLRLVQVFLDTATQHDSTMPYITIPFATITDINIKPVSQSEEDIKKTVEVYANDILFINRMAGYRILQDFDKIWMEDPMKAAEDHIRLKLPDFHINQIYRLGDGKNPSRELQKLQEVQFKIERILDELKMRTLREDLRISDILSKNVSVILRCIENKGIGYLVIDGVQIAIGKIGTRKYRLIKCLCDPFGVQKKLDTVFDAVRLAKDDRDGYLNNPLTRMHRKITIIENTFGEVQEMLRKKGKPDSIRLDISPHQIVKLTLT